MALLTKKDILEADDEETRVLDVPEWGGEVRLRGLTGFERDQFESSVMTASGTRNLTNVRARLLALCIVDADACQLFTYGDIAALGGKAAKPLDRVFTAAMALSGLNAADVEDLAGNSGGALSADIGSS